MTSPLSNCPFCDEISSTQATFCPTCGSPLYLNNRYRITNLLAKGETSEVFKAQDVACANQAVTIKRFIQKIPGEKGLASIEDDCKREGRFLAVCNHHSIPRLYDYFSWNENWYLVRSFIDGETLARYWSRARREMRLTLEQILDIGIQVCSTLQYLHNQPRPIIFRDLSPSNIMLAPASAPGERSYHIYLLDFGGACYLDEARLSSTKISGTQGYVAPEVIHRRASLRSDIYSLGAVLFQLVSGIKPTERASHAEHLRPQDHLPQQGSDELWSLIGRMMEEDDEDRQYSAAEAKRALQRIARQLVLPADVADLSPRHVSPRRAVLTAVGTGIAGLLLGGGAVGTFLRSHPHAFTTLKVGSKLDNEALLLGEMYILLLQNASYQVIDQTITGGNIEVFSSLVNKEIDIYPEYTQAGLTRLQKRTTGNLQQDFQMVSEEYQKNYQLIWLSIAAGLNDNYCVAMPQSKARELGISNLSALAKYSQTHSLTVAVAPEGMADVVPELSRVYGLVFSNPYATGEQESFQDVLSGKADINVCYSTDPLLNWDHFIRLEDDKGALPADSPAPLIRTDVLKIAPDIDGILKPLATVLSTEESTSLQAKLPSATVNKETRRKTAQQVASTWLKEKGLL